MRPSEIRPLLSIRRPLFHASERAVRDCASIEDLRRRALRYWPKGVRGYVEGGSDGEVSLSRNRAAFESYALVQHTLRDVSDIDTGCQILGSAAPFPVALGPTAYTRMMHPDAETAVARAASSAGVPYTLSTMATTRLEDLARNVPGGRLWFQLYVWRDRGLTMGLVDRAQESGFQALMLTVDTPVVGNRVRDQHSGFTLPPTLTPPVLLDMAWHPAWALRLLMGPPITFANFDREISADPQGLMEFAAKQFDPSVTWDDVAQIRARWRGPLVVKGIADPRDVARAAEAGVDAVVLSNHGGRQLDQSVAPVHRIRPVRDLVGDRLAVFVDSGVRRGSDIAVAMCLGADGVLIGRAYLYGLGAGGQAGVSTALSLLGTELRRTMALLGATSVAELRERGAELLADRTDRGQ